MTLASGQSPAPKRATGVTPKRPTTIPASTPPDPANINDAGARGTRPRPQPRLSLPARLPPSNLSPRVERDRAGGLKTPTPRPGQLTPRVNTPRTPVRATAGPSSARAPRLGNEPGALENGLNPSSLSQWAALSPAVDLLIDQGFPEIISEPTNWDDPITEDGWELRTETVGVSDEYDDSPIAVLKTQHQHQLTHYKNLLVRSQSASSSSLHDIHSQLHILQREFNDLRAEHDLCAQRVQATRTQDDLASRALEGVTGDFERTLKSFSKEDRVRLLGLVIEACQPSDINAQIAILEKYRRSRYDILSRLDEDIAVRTLSLLDVKDLLNLRLVSRGYRKLTENGELWRLLCRQMEWRDWDGEAGLSHLKVPPEGGWEELYKSLRRREKNWNTGLAQKVFVLKGHTNYVTSLRLRGDVLISGSYDESIRIWNLPPLLTLSPSAMAPPLVLPAKSVSCLDYYPPSEVFVAGYHDVGRVQVWRKKLDQWELTHTLSGHLHGIRAVALNGDYLVSAGADKALVVWSWKTGEKIVRFGQQTNICVGIHLVHDYIVAVTVDGVIRTFDIRKREMLAQFKISDLARSLPATGGGHGDDEGRKDWRAKLKEVGGGQGGVGMINWFEGQGRWMTCATREMIIRLEWNEVEELVPLPSSLVSQATPSPSKPRIRTVSSVSRGLPSASMTTPTKPTPQRTRTASTSTPSVSSKRSGAGLSPGTTKVTPMTRAISGEAPSTPSPLKGKGKVSLSQLGRSPSPLTHSSSPRKPLSSPDPTRAEAEGKRRVVPLFTKAPRLVELVNAPDVEKGAIDARRTRVVTSTRFAARTGANRHLYIGVPRTRSTPGPDITAALAQRQGTQMIPVLGAWSEMADPLHLQTPEKNPMSLVLDREKFVYGCTDGSIVVVGFVGHEYGGMDTQAGGSLQRHLAP